MTRKVEKSLLWHKLVLAVAALWLLVPAAAGLAVTNGKIAFQTNTHGTTVSLNLSDCTCMLLPISVT